MQQSVFDLDSEQEALDHFTVDWERMQRCRYLIHQRLDYTYPSPIYDLKQRLMILPPEHYGNQQRRMYRFEVSLPATRHATVDSFGNTQINLHVPEVTGSIRFETWIQVERWREPEYQEISGDWLSDPHLLEPSALTRPDAALHRLATHLLARGNRGVDLAHEINLLVYQHMQYAHDVTTIRTTAANAYALRRGVCQDYAHLMLALCRLCGLPARYVSGHLLGEGGTHAWVEVLVPGKSGQAIVVPFDPTHGRQTDLSYLTISVGRDYYDVAPTSGTFHGTCSGELDAYKQVRLTLLEYAPDESEGA